jgi:LacI family transcriptional regulator
MLGLENHARSAQSFVKSYAEYNPGSPEVEIIEAHEDEDEAFRKCFALLSSRTSIAGIYVNTVNCLPVCRAISACGLSGKIRLIASDLFRELIPYFDKGTVSASIHGRPYALGETAIRLAVDHIVNSKPLPPIHRLMPHVVMRSNCRLFHEVRQPPTEALEMDSSWTQVAENGFLS